MWTPVIDGLVAAGFRCVAYDQRGHGGSGGSPRALAPFADDVAAMLDAEPAGCVVVGASLGGFAAIGALSDPVVRARVAGLVLVDVVPDPDPERVRRFLGAGGVGDGHVELIEDILSQASWLRRVVSELDLPVLLVRGDDRSPLTDEDADRLLGLAPNATAVSIPGAGHLVARDQPAALARAIAVTAVWPALALLRGLGAEQLPHPGGNLLDHLRRVHDLVADWDGSPRARLAALCHAAYGTAGFPHALLPLEQRAVLRGVIGHDAEELVYRYDACDRSYGDLGATPLRLRDRFTGEVVTMADAVDFCLLTAANELDIARFAPLTAEGRRGIRALIGGLAAHIPEIVDKALTDPSLVEA